MPLEPFSGAEHFDAPPDRVHAVITDLQAMAAAMPDVSNVTRIDDRTVRATVRPNLAFLKTTMKVTVELIDSTPPTAATMRIRSEGIGASILVESTLTLDPAPHGCDLSWHATILELKGLVAALSPSLIRAAAEQVIREGWTRVRNQLNSP